MLFTDLVDVPVDAVQNCTQETLGSTHSLAIGYFKFPQMESLSSTFRQATTVSFYVFINWAFLISFPTRSKFLLILDLHKGTKFTFEDLWDGFKESLDT